MKTNNQTTPLSYHYIKKIVFISLSFGLLTISLPILAQGEETNSPQENQKNNTIHTLNNTSLEETYTQKIDEESQKIYHQYIANPENQDSIITSTYPQDYMMEENITVTEDGNNLMVVRGSSRNRYNTSFNSSYNSTYQQNNSPITQNSPCENEMQSNSTNANSGLYMNVTNPDGSSMNFGAYFNANTNSNQPRRKSSAQIFVDKKE